MKFKEIIKQLKEKQFAVAIERDGGISTILKKKDEASEKEKFVYRYYGTDVDYADGYTFQNYSVDSQKRLFELDWKILS